MKVRPKKDIIRSHGYNKPTLIFSSAKNYIVYALEKRRFNERYFLISDADPDMPLPFNASDFIVEEEGFPENWITTRSGTRFLGSSLTSFPEWAQDPGVANRPGYYERLADSEPNSKEHKILEKYRALFKS